MFAATIKTLRYEPEAKSFRKLVLNSMPGTVLATLLNNNKLPDPFYGMNNKLIKDVYHTGNAYYTYWFVKSFKQFA